MIYLKLTLSLIAVLFLFSLTASGVRVARLSGSAAHSKTTRIYLAINGSDETNMMMCDIIPKTASLRHCKAMGHMGITSFWDMAFNPANNLAYIIDRSSLDIKICSVNSTDGTLFGCRPGNTYLDLKPRSIAFNAAGTLAYVPSFCSNQIAVCSVSPNTGQLENCNISYIPGIYDLAGIAVSPKGTKVYGGFNLGKDKTFFYTCKVDPKTKEIRDCRFQPTLWKHGFLTHIRVYGTYGFTFQTEMPEQLPYFTIDSSSESVKSLASQKMRAGYSFTPVFYDIAYTEDLKYAIMLAKRKRYNPKLHSETRLIHCSSDTSGLPIGCGSVSTYGLPGFNRFYTSILIHSS